MVNILKEDIAKVKESIIIQKLKIKSLKKQLLEENHILNTQRDSFEILLQQYAHYLCHKNHESHSIAHGQNDGPLTCDYFTFYKESNGYYYGRTGTSICCDVCHLTINVDDKIDSDKIDTTFNELIKYCSYSRDKMYYGKYKYQFF
jgi:hypothetical protein